MAAVGPIPFNERNPGYTVEQLLTWHRKELNSSDNDSDSDLDERSSFASESSSSEAFSELSSSASSSDASVQEDDSASASDSSSNEADTSDYSSDDGGRPATETLVHRRPQHDLLSLDTAQSFTTDVLNALGDMARADNVGFFAWLIPATGICTMLSTELLACVNHFNCSENYPTLSYAATFRPEGYAFTTGMCLTAVFIFVTVVLFWWYLRLRTHQQQTQRVTFVGYAVVVLGASTAISLCGLAILDMRGYHDTHIVCTVVFFLSAWLMMIAVQIARRTILKEDESDGKVSSAEMLEVLRRRSFWRSLRRWRRLDFVTAYTLARVLLNVGLASTFLFGVFFLCANGLWPNPLGFTAVQEAFFEAFAIVCQLLYMGTLSCELARLAPLVEHRDYLELERSE